MGLDVLEPPRLHFSCSRSIRLHNISEKNVKFFPAHHASRSHDDKEYTDTDGNTRHSILQQLLPLPLHCAVEQNTLQMTF